MTTPMSTRPGKQVTPELVNGEDLPILYEDDAEGDLGESNPHFTTDEILHACLTAHLRPRPEYRVYADMNLYYPTRIAGKIERPPYVSPDIMVVKPSRILEEDIVSYWVDRDGPPPELTMEILSERSGQQGDLTEKLTVYARLKVSEYILVDVTGKYLPQKLALKRLQRNGRWKDEKDPDGGVTSRLGFRLVIEADGKARLIDLATGRRYLRPTEAEEAVQAGEKRIRALEKELVRLRKPSRQGKTRRKK